MVTALRSALWARQSLGGHRDPKGAASYGGGGSVLPKPTYGWSGQTLQTGEAAVALQPSLSSLSRLTFVTTRSLGTLKWGQGCVGLRVADPLLARRTPRSVRGMCRCTQHHSPAFLELQRDQRDPWALVHPAGRKKDIRRCQRPEAPPRSHEFGISGVSEPAPCSAPQIRATVTISSYWCLTASLNALSTGARNKPRGEPLHIFSHKETLNPKPLCQHSPSRLCLLVFQWDQQGRGRQGLQEHREHPQGRSHHDHPASRQQRGQICAKPHSFWHGDGECQWGAHGKLTFTPAAPSLPGGPSAPGLP